MTSFVIKIIALAAMITDHIGDVYSHAIPESFLMRCIGRLAFPLYAYMIAEGCRQTKNLKKYMIRLGVFAFISEIPFDLCFENMRVRSLNDIKFFTANNQNIFFSLFLAVLAIYIWERLKDTKYILAGVLAFPASAVIAQQIRSDYGGTAVIMIAAMYFLPNKITRIAAMVAGVALLYLPMGYTGYIFGHRVPFGFTLFLFASAAAVPVFFYNGKRGPGLKYIFYMMYPLHLLILALVQILPII